MNAMKLKRILAYMNNVLTSITGSLLILVFSISLPEKKKKLIRIPIGINILLLTVLLIIIAAFGGAFSKKSATEHVTVNRIELAG
jgi:hypothetical protein